MRTKQSKDTRCRQGRGLTAHPFTPKQGRLPTYGVACNVTAGTPGALGEPIQLALERSVEPGRQADVFMTYNV